MAFLLWCFCYHIFMKEKNITEQQLEEIEIKREVLSERIYGAITLLAVNLGLLLNPKYLTLSHAFSVIITTTLGLWAASLFASFMSYRIVHDNFMPKKEFIHSIIIHRGILLSALPSIIFLAFAATGLIKVQTALTVDIALAFTAMTVMILQSAKTHSNSLKNAFLSISIQAVVAVVIIAIKLFSH